MKRALRKATDLVLQAALLYRELAVSALTLVRDRRTASAWDRF